MVLPDAFNGSIDNLHYYQGVIIAQVAVTLVIYIVLRIVHFVKWGYLQDDAAKEKQPNAASSQQQTTKKWDQKVWDVYFPIIYTNHMAALALTLCFIPYIFSTIMAYIHFAAFCGLIIVNIFVKDAQVGNGNRTKASRIFWLIMCVMNVVLIIAGLSGVPKVLA